MTKQEKLLDCNCCGKTCAKPSAEHYPDSSCPPCNYGLNNANFTTGYFSKVFEDLSQVTFSMCEECLFKLFEIFVVKPKIEQIELGGMTWAKMNKKKYICT